MDFKESGKTAPAHPKATPVSPHPLPSAAPTGGNFPASARIYVPPSDMKAIASASVEVLTSTSLVPLRDLIAAAREQQRQVTADLKEATDEAARQWAELSRKKASIFRWFFRRRIASLEQELPMIEGEVKRLKEWERNTKISVDFEAAPEAQRAYEQMVRAFEVLRRSACKWDVTADRATNQPRERTNAHRAVDRKPVSFDFSTSDIIRFSGRAMRFENANGDDILIYPGVAVIPRADGVFALIDLRELKVEARPMQFQEEDNLPGDAMVVGHTWAKTNKNGTPDRRFKDNYQIPLCLYGEITFRSKTGITEEYHVSNAEAAVSFAQALQAYQQALSLSETPRKAQA
ncbi:hypothetical protein [Paracoccus chinensis]|uniref:hypothetical protein n=1 Tax=Paracoccus chinensis TaxID=525640 RepID=UPI001FE18E4D|nr:hypothetical protein [Paracoccus chinensis]